MLRLEVMPAGIPSLGMSFQAWSWVGYSCCEVTANAGGGCSLSCWEFCACQGSKAAVPAGSGVPGLGRHVLPRAVHAVLCDGVSTGSREGISMPETGNCGALVLFKSHQKSSVLLGIPFLRALVAGIISHPPPVQL